MNKAIDKVVAIFSHKHCLVFYKVRCRLVCDKLRNVLAIYSCYLEIEKGQSVMNLLFYCKFNIVTPIVHMFFESFDVRLYIENGEDVINITHVQSWNIPSAMIGLVFQMIHKSVSEGKR